jgi:adenine phosphoribosyltransferase
MNLRKYIRDVPDWPKKGILFKDITPLLQTKEPFRFAIDSMLKPFSKHMIDKVVAIDARGFLLATPIAYKLKCGVCIVRKKGKLPFSTIEETYQKEYGPDTLAIHKDAIMKGENILIVDDILATGGTVKATSKLVERLGGKIVGMSFLINLPFLGGSKKLNKYNIKYLVSYNFE